MQREVSTNVRLPEEIWKAIKIRAAEEGKSMKELILEGISKVLGRTEKVSRKGSLKDSLLEFMGTVESDVTDGSVNHDKYIYDK